MRNLEFRITSSCDIDERAVGQAQKMVGFYTSNSLLRGENTEAYIESVEMLFVSENINQIEINREKTKSKKAVLYFEFIDGKYSC